MNIHGCVLGCAALLLACGSKNESDAVEQPGADAGGDAGPPAVLPPLSDYGALGPFPTITVTDTGPDGQYMIFRPETLGENGFKHPPATWGNGIGTTPAYYTDEATGLGLLTVIASHGFVIIGSNSTTVNAQLMTAGLDWLLAQDTAPGDFQGKLDTSHAVSIGYSLGGRAAVAAGAHPNVVTTVSFHGLAAGESASLRGPLLLITGSNDTFVVPATSTDVTFAASTVPTFYATLIDATHVWPLFTAGDERAPTVAWLRMQIYGDQGARSYFYGPDCILCRAPWTNPQTKNWQ